MAIERDTKDVEEERKGVRLVDVESVLERVFIAAENTTLRSEDRKKAVEVHALLVELERLVRGRKQPLTLVDAAAGKAYLGLLAGSLVLGPKSLTYSVLAIERDVARVTASLDAASMLELAPRFTARAGLVNHDTMPESPTIVAALHACGDASDAVIDATISRRAKHLLLVPCCTARSVRGAACAERIEQAHDLPRHGGVRKRVREALVLAERVTRLEAAGYATEVVDFVPLSVTPYNVLLRARRVDEPVRRARAQDSLAKLTEL